MKTEVTVLVSKEAYELSKGIVKFIGTIKKEVEDNEGWSMIDDLPGILTALPDLISALDGAMSIPEEINEDRGAFARAMVLGLSDIADLFVKKGE